MSIQRLVAATVVGGLVMYGVGFLIWGVFLADFYATSVGSATGVERDVVVFWAILLGQLAESALLVFVLTRSDQAKTPTEGLKVGALVGFLMWLGASFIYYGNTNIWTLTVTVLDPFLEAIRFAVCGAVVAMVLGRGGLRSASV